MARQRDLVAHQERLSAATWAVLAEQGLAGLTVRAVAERAGCTTGLVMHTFPDKRALLRHARELLHRRTAERADRAEAGSAHPRDRLRAVLAQAAALTPDKLEEARVWLGFSAAAVADPELADLHVRHHRVFQDRVARLVGQVVADRDDQGATARALVAMTEGLSALAALDPAGYSPSAQEQAIDAALTCAIDGQGVGKPNR